MAEETLLLEKIIEKNSEHLRNLKYTIDSKITEDMSNEDLRKYEQHFIEKICDIQIVRMDNVNLLDELAKHRKEVEQLDSMLENKALLISRIDDKIYRMDKFNV